MTIIHLVKPVRPVKLVGAVASTVYPVSATVFRLPLGQCTVGNPGDLVAGDGEPSPEDLADIEDEWPLIAAEVDLVDAEIRVLTAEPHPTELDWRRLRRAEARVGQEVVALVGRGLPVDWAA